MKILVCAKRVVDANVKVRVKSDNSDVDIEHSKMSLNPFDENAIEEASRLKEAGIATEIIVVSIGSAKCADTLRTALARGCDRAILVETDMVLEPLSIAKILQQIVLRETPDLVLLGKQAIDDDANQVGQMLAGMLDYPQSTFISKIEVIGNVLLTTRELDNGTEVLELSMPAVLTADLYLNEPRFIKLPQLMLAKKKPLEHLMLSDMDIKLRSTTRLLKAFDGEVKKQCKFINTVPELFEVLQAKKVI
ncbi:MAG: electron transfer flavoprotein subunit beta/FixA family protein [Proteobacteria bacterium]|jgi:electron transfer flavoprotein beta subunit|nr:electron transfer flavoprotein subunit beta/FixA family protein [Pseudomonadota bacterium]